MILYNLKHEVNALMDSIHALESDMFGKQVNSAIQQSLKSQGFNFYSDNEFLEWAKDNLIVISTVDNPNIRQIYILESQTLIGWFDDTVSLRQDGDKFIVTCNYFHPVKQPSSS